MQIYPVRGALLRENQKKCNFFRKIKEKLLEIRKIVVPLYRVKELTRPTERVFGTKKHLKNENYFEQNGRQDEYVDQRF